MSFSDLSTLTSLAMKFRNAIEAAKSELYTDPALKNFPHGCCGDASEMLGYFMHQNGAIGFEYVCGTKRSTSSTHAWLERENIVVDITLDQFSNKYPQVYVGIKKSLYLSYAETQRQQCITNINEFECARLADLYGVILKYTL